MKVIEQIYLMRREILRRGMKPVMLYLGDETYHRLGKELMFERQPIFNPEDSTILGIPFLRVYKNEHIDLTGE